MFSVAIVDKGHSLETCLGPKCEVLEQSLFRNVLSLNFISLVRIPVLEEEDMGLQIDCDIGSIIMHLD